MIGKILDKHHYHYILTFNDFMNTVRSDLNEKINQINKLEHDRQKQENIHLITAERDFFRLEALRLNELCASIYIYHRIYDKT
jgi:hypothetical protein